MLHKTNMLIELRGSSIDIENENITHLIKPFNNFREASTSVFGICKNLAVKCNISCDLEENRNVKNKVGFYL